MAATTMTHGAIQAALADRMACTFQDPEYAFVTESYLRGKFLPWWSRHKGEAGINYRPGVWDCEDFARQFRAQMVLAGRAFPGPAAVCCAVLYARNLKPSFGIQPGNHALNLVGVLDRADTPRWRVVEPQNGLHVDLDNFHAADRMRAAF